MPPKLLNDQLVLQPYHLIQKEVELDNTHLATHSTKCTEPIVSLLTDGSVERPSTVVILQLRKRSRVAMLLAEFVLDRVLVQKMPHVNDEANVVEERIVPLDDLLLCVACAVVDEELGDACAPHRAGMLEEDLDQV